MLTGSSLTKPMKCYIVTLLVLSAGLVTSRATDSDSIYTLVVEARGAQPEVGQALFALFDSKKSFLREPHITRKQPISGNGTAKFQVEGLAAGSYAVSVVYDKDSNGKLNTGFLGIPKEKVGVSNNPKARLGPPKFKDAVFELTKDTRLEIILGDAK